MVAYMDTERVIDVMPLSAGEVALSSAVGSSMTPAVSESKGGKALPTPLKLLSQVQGSFLGGARLCLSLLSRARVPMLPLAADTPPVTQAELVDLWELVGSVVHSKKGSDTFTGASRFLIDLACGGAVVSGIGWVAGLAVTGYEAQIWFGVSMAYLVCSVPLILWLNNYDTDSYNARWDTRMAVVCRRMKVAGMSVSSCVMALSDILTNVADPGERLSVSVLRDMGLDASLRMSRLVTALESAYADRLSEVSVDGEANELLSRILEFNKNRNGHQGKRVIGLN